MSWLLLAAKGFHVQKFVSSVFDRSGASSAALASVDTTRKGTLLARNFGEVNDLGYLEGSASAYPLEDWTKNTTTLNKGENEAFLAGLKEYTKKYETIYEIAVLAQSPKRLGDIKPNVFNSELMKWETGAKFVSKDGGWDLNDKDWAQNLQWMNFKDFAELHKKPGNELECDYLMITGSSKKMPGETPFGFYLKNKVMYTNLFPRHCHVLLAQVGKDETSGLNSYYRRWRPTVMLMDLIKQKIIKGIELKEPWMHGSDADLLFTNKFHGVDWLVRRLRRTAQFSLTTLENDDMRVQENQGFNPFPTHFNDFGYFVGLDAYCGYNFFLNVGTVLMRPSPMGAFLAEVKVFQKTHGRVNQYGWDIEEQAAIDITLDTMGGYSLYNVLSLCQGVSDEEYRKADHFGRDLGRAHLKHKSVDLGAKFVAYRRLDPERVKNKDPDLYSLLQSFFGQDVASRDGIDSFSAGIPSQAHMNSFGGGMPRHDQVPRTLGFVCGDFAVHLSAVTKTHILTPAFRAQFVGHQRCRNVMPSFVFQTPSDFLKGGQ